MRHIKKVIPIKSSHRSLHIHESTWIHIERFANESLKTTKSTSIDLSNIHMTPTASSQEKKVNKKCAASFPVWQTEFTREHCPPRTLWQVTTMQKHSCWPWLAWELFSEQKRAIPLTTASFMSHSHGGRFVFCEGNEECYERPPQWLAMISWIFSKPFHVGHFNMGCLKHELAFIPGRTSRCSWNGVAMVNIMDINNLWLICFPCQIQMYIPSTNKSMFLQSLIRKLGETSKVYQWRQVKLLDDINNGHQPSAAAMWWFTIVWVSDITDS